MRNTTNASNATATEQRKQRMSIEHDPSQANATHLDERAPLSPELILTKALELADREGIDALSIRKLASELNVTHMAVYHYFRSKQEIVDRFLDLVVGELNPCDHTEEDWQDWMLVTFQRFRSSFRKHPAAVSLIGSWGAIGPAAVQVMESVLDCFRNRGKLSNELAVQGFYTLLKYTAGYCAIETITKGQGVPSERRDSERWIEGLISRYDVEEARAFPNIVECAPALGKYWSEEQFDNGIRGIILGLLEISKRDTRKS